MRKVFINKKIELLAETYSKDLFQARTGSFVMPKIKLEKLRDSLKPRKHKNYRDYIDKILSKYEDILKAKPSEMQTLISEFNPLLSSFELKQNVNNKKLKFYECVVAALRYEDIRGAEFLDCLNDLSIKICIYCHAQLAIIAKTDIYDSKTRKYKSNRSAKLELDHFHPKSRYPFLATSFFNLYPVCGNCNRGKSATEIKFELYSEDNDLDIFNFWLTDDSIIKYLNTYDKKDLVIHFDNLKGDHLLRKSYNEIFDIQGIYDTQKDIAEELIYKAKVYTKSYKEDLINDFNELFIHPDLLDRLILGNYSLHEEMHNRPMAKFSQDIARQLGLIT